MLNSMIYEVDIPDREVKDYAANVIAENGLILLEINAG